VPGIDLKTMLVAIIATVIVAMRSLVGAVDGGYLHDLLPRCFAGRHKDVYPITPTANLVDMV